MCCLRHVITALLQQYIIGPVSDFESLDNNVLAKLRDAKVLAFDCEGVDLSRLGPISLVSIATLELCVIFDVLKAERTQGVVDLLKDLLESPDIIKVSYDRINNEQRKQLHLKQWLCTHAVILCLPDLPANDL
eukprot:349706-Chlamydomonas_euryale.AAC.7